ncbi:MAG TPA: hypothetical protein VKC33_00860 [Burkholderiales bacterium]|nr:hypothetical protein [Burkholderiales bacterium]
MTLQYRITICAAAMILLVTHISGAEEGSVKEDARKAGQAVGSAAREAWQGAKKAGKEIGHEAKKAGQAVGGAAKEGAQELKRAFKGEK